ncbi:MAG: hypothetical protein LBS90_01720 [Oscillospiraceae bacterium]|jgi:hypothetical protein|nr:hypothetical protein [Oscillospiraceae bacterium]
MGALVYLISSPLFWGLFILAAVFGAGVTKFLHGRPKKPVIPKPRPQPPALKPAEPEPPPAVKPDCPPDYPNAPQSPGNKPSYDNPVYGKPDNGSGKPGYGGEPPETYALINQGSRIPFSPAPVYKANGNGAKAPELRVRKFTD